jgi:hypothetical protein
MKTYPLTPSQFNALRTRLLEAGITLPNDKQGVLSFKGIELKYSYFPPDSMRSGSLVLSILKRPLLISANLIWGQVDQWIGGL